MLRSSRNSSGWVRGATIGILIGLVVFVFTMTLAPATALNPWVWLLLFGWFLVLWSLVGARREPLPEPSAGPRMLPPAEQPAVVQEVMDIRLAEEERGVQRFRGTLREPASAAFEHLKRALEPQAIPLLQRDERCGAAILVLPRPVERAVLEKPTRVWLHWLLLVATLVTTTWAGARQQGVNLLDDPAGFVFGLPYSLALLAILGVHELGHYWTARHYRMDVTPPFFIPVPFALGTFGAFIRMRSPSENRRTLFDVAVAGPLAGLVVAIPALLIGLRYSEVLPLPPAAATSLFGSMPKSSILFALLAKLSLGDALQAGGVVRLSPMAFAGWLGLFITGLNLLPIGQLDGGHIARAMFGTRAGAAISSVAMWSLVLLGVFVWPGLLTWALLVFFIAGRGTPPLNDLTPVGGGRVAVGVLAFLILLLVTMPVPTVVSHLLGFSGPYL